MDEHNDSVVLMLDRPRELKCTHRVMKRLSSMRHCSVMDIERQLMDYDGASALVYCMMAAEDPTLTVERADELLDMVKPGRILTAAMEAYTAAFSDDADEAEESDDPTAAAGTGM